MSLREVKMPIYIARNYEGFIENIVLAKNKELATVYWQGKGIYAHSVSERTEDELNDHITGVIPILNTTKITSYFRRDQKPYLIVSNE